MSTERNLARQWLAKARNDLLNADNNLKSESVPYDTVCFHCQQAAEKLLKAYLVARGIQPSLTHDLLLLLEEVLPLCADAESLRDDLALLMPYAVQVRYPDEVLIPTDEDAREARRAAQRVLDRLELHLEGLFLYRGQPVGPCSMAQEDADAGRFCLPRVGGRDRIQVWLARSGLRMKVSLTM